MTANYSPSPFTIFCGKGGVGKTTLSLAFALWQAELGRSVVVVTSHPLPELAACISLAGLKERFPQAAAHLFIVCLEPRAVLNDKVKEYIPSGVLQKAVLWSRIYNSLVEIAPGLKEIVFLDRLRQLVQGETKQIDGQRFELLVWDAPATGHFLQTMKAARDFEQYLSGPFALMGKELTQFFSVPSVLSVLPVTTLEEMAVQETIELCEKLRNDLKIQPKAILCNLTSPALTKREESSETLTDAMSNAASNDGDWQFIRDRLRAERTLFVQLREKTGTPLKIVERTADWESDVELLSGLAGQLAAQFASEGKGE